MNTLFIGQQVTRLRVVDSTNNYAAKLLKMPNWAEGTVIVSDYQTAGKGRNGNLWQGDEGSNLYYSVLLKPGFLAVQHSFLLSIAAAIAVQRTVAELLTNSDVQVKWPNDVYVGDQKIAGILIETQIRSGQLHSAIVGIGLNINQNDYPDTRGTSLASVSGQEFEISGVLDLLCEHFEASYLMIRSKPIEAMELYHSLLLGKGKKRSYQFLDGTDEAELIQVLIDGRAKFRRGEREEICNIDQVKWIW